VTVYAVGILIVLAMSPHFIDPTGKPVGADFLCFWAAGGMALEGRAADTYDFDQLLVAEQKSMQWKEGQSAPRLPWMYPPTFMLAAETLARMPYGLALATWSLATLAVYLAAIHGILPGRAAILAALGFPAVLSNLTHGQNGFLTAGLLGCALVVLERRPWVAGILFGLLAYKPQFAPLIPLALVVGGYWRTIGAAAITVLASTGLSWIVFGPAPWQAFFNSLKIARVAGLEHGSAGWEKIQSLFAAVRMLGGNVELAYAAQAVSAGVAAIAVVWIWRKPVPPAIKNAVLAVGMLTFTPYILDYDLVILALPIAWLTAVGLREGFLPWEKITLFAAWLLPLLARRVGADLHLPLSPAIMAMLLGMIVRRANAGVAQHSCGVSSATV
jgi:hypothetical protein